MATSGSQREAVTQLMVINMGESVERGAVPTSAVAGAVVGGLVLLAAVTLILLVMITVCKRRSVGQCEVDSSYYTGKAISYS